MEQRIRTAGITTVSQLCALSRDQMSSLWGSVWGARLWLWLRGEDFQEPASRPLQSLSRQHILPPDCREPDKARGIAVKLLLTTARRMRRCGLRAKYIGMHLGFQDGRVWQMGMRIPPSQDLLMLQAHFLLIWNRAPRLKPSDLTVLLSELESASQGNLFDPAVPASGERVTAVVDQLNLRYGLHTIYPGSIHAVRQQAPTRISFGPPPPLEEFNDPADKLP